MDVADNTDRRRRSSSAARPASPPDAVELSVEDVVTSARRQIAALTGKGPVSVTSVDPTEDGWVVEVELLEEERIPASLDVLALYELELDVDGQLVSYRRTGRYSRASSLKDAK